MEQQNCVRSKFTNTYCEKCGSYLTAKRVIGYDGKEFCCRECKNDFYAEIRQENNACFNEFIRRD